MAQQLETLAACPSRGPDFSSQHVSGGSQLLVTPGIQIAVPFSGLHRQWHTCSICSHRSQQFNCCECLASVTLFYSHQFIYNWKDCSSRTESPVGIWGKEGPGTHLNDGAIWKAVWQ